MNKPVFYITLLLWLVILPVCAQQNLVYNGDFEEYSDCPMSESGPFQFPKEIEKCIGWSAPTYGTSDYFHECALGTNVEVPANILGEQNTYSGSGYLGAYLASYNGGSGTDGYNGPMWWEYVQGELIQPLVKDNIYSIQLRVSLAEGSDLAVNEFGAYFSPESISSQNTANLNVVPQVTFQENGYYLDTIDWMPVEGYFISNGEEKFITIGNFKDNNVTDTLRRYPIVDGYAFFSSYYYIDDVKVINVTDQFSFPNVFTPNNDGINDVWQTPFSGEDVFTISIVNRWGNTIVEDDFGNFKWDGKTESGKDYAEGVYFYVVRNNESKEVFKSGFIHLVR